MDEKNTEKAIENLLLALGRDSKSEELIDTPKRVSKAYSKILEGYGRDLSEEMTIFPNVDEYKDIIYSGKINFFSICEHHLLPFFGVAHVAYIPDKSIAGLSKLSRAVDIYARRLQQQERIAVQVAEELNDLLEPVGIAVLLEGQHLCNTARGVQQVNSNMKTMAFHGTFKTDSSLRSDFFKLIQ